MQRVVVVGGGVIGMMHAYFAELHGFRVVHLEREKAARGASVRNFGLIWVSGRAPGAELRLALRARELWEDITARVPGLGFRPHGSLTVACDETELKLLAAAAALPDASERGFRLLDGAELRSVNPAVRGAALGALHCGVDAIVEPRLAPRALRSALETSHLYRWLPGREAVSITAHTVLDQEGSKHDGDLVVICPGAAHGGVLGDELTKTAIRRVRLQMMQTDPFAGDVTTSLADVDSLRYYPAYAGLGLNRLPPQPPEAARVKAQLLLVQRLDGALTIGDTHEHDEPFGFDLDEGAYDHLRSRAEQLLGQSLPPTRRRWAGVYSQVTDDRLYHRSEPAPGVVVVTGVGGRGMTCAPAIAEETFR
jgi:FAD dependent oxidoreductase TIGR03364